jgi:DNA-binding beta-propeller fold protein YncE
MRLISFIIIVLLFFSCKKEKPDPEVVSTLDNGMLVLCEGLFQQNNASLSWLNFSTDEVDIDFFNSKNGRLLGDTGNDMQIYGGKIYIVVNNSNTIEILSKSTGTSIKQISMMNGSVGKQPRSIAFSGSKAVITCYEGFVDVLDTTSLTITQRIQVGSNPEDVAVSNGKLFVSNSGGLNSPNLDSTVSIINLTTFQEITRITVGKNPGFIEVDSQGDVYVIARGNYGTIPSRMVKINPVSNEVEQTFPFDASGMERMNDYFLVSFYNYSNQTSEIRLFNTLTETIENNSFINTSSITTLYGVKYNPKSDKIYCLDAMSFTNTGYVKQFSSTGILEKSFHVGLNPSKIIFYE